MASRAAARRRRQREVAARWAQPQVEVSHEFDSTGLLNVDAEDKDFGKRAANQPSSSAFEIDSAGFLNVGAEDDGAVKGEKITIIYDEGRLTEETTPALHGQSQIEETFEIDSNGLLHVGAEDKGPAVLAPDICGPEAVAPREPPAAAERGPLAHRGDLLRDPVRAALRAPAAAKGHDLVLPPAADGVPHAGAPCEPLAADDRELLALPAGAARDPLADAPRELLAADDRELLALPARAVRDPLADAPREPLAADDRELLALPARAARDPLADVPREPLAADDRELLALPARAARDPLIDAPRGPLAADDRELLVLPARAVRDPLADAPREPLAADDREHFALRAGAVRDPFDEVPREPSAPDREGLPSDKQLKQNKKVAGNLTQLKDDVVAKQEEIQPMVQKESDLYHKKIGEFEEELKVYQDGMHKEAYYFYKFGLVIAMKRLADVTADLDRFDQRMKDLNHIAVHFQYPEEIAKPRKYMQAMRDEVANWRTLWECEVQNTNDNGTRTEPQGEKMREKRKKKNKKNKKVQGPRDDDFAADPEDAEDQDLIGKVITHLQRSADEDITVKLLRAKGFDELY